MREPEFPFAKYREWGITPECVPEIDVEAIRNLADWQAHAFKRPIRDDITGHYSFYPSLNGAAGYVNRAHARLFAGKTALTEGLSEEEFQGKKERQPLHIAESAESAIAVFWVISQMRAEVLQDAISRVAKNEFIPHENGMWVANAIADYGHSLLHPKDIDHTGKEFGGELAKVIKRIGGSAANDLEQFGLYAEVEPEVLSTDEGLVVMEATLAEQKRRCEFWSPRHEAILKAFPDVKPSNEVLYLQLPLEELISIEFIDTTEV